MGVVPMWSATKFPPFYQGVSQFKSALTLVTHSNVITSLQALSPNETTLNHQISDWSLSWGKQENVGPHLTLGLPL